MHIRAINGALYYTELKSDHRRDLVVTPDEVVRLLEGQPVEQALRRDPGEEDYIPPASGGLYKGAPALLAGEAHLLELSGDKIFLQGVPYERHGKQLSSLGDVLENGF